MRTPCTAASLAMPCKVIIWEFNLSSEQLESKRVVFVLGQGEEVMGKDAFEVQMEENRNPFLDFLPFFHL